MGASPPNGVDSPAAPGVLGERFPRAARVRQARDFERLLARGARAGGQHVVVHLIVNGLPNSRLGLVVSRKVGGAVTRNRFKRRVREIFRRRLRPELDASGVAFDLLVRALPAASRADQHELEAELQALVLRIRRRESRRPASGDREGEP